MSLLKNSLWNLIGSALPLAIAVPAMGYIARELDIESFGIFTLLFAIVGYATLFEVGLSRAVIREISLANRDINIEKKIIGTASIAVFALSAIGTSLLYLASASLARTLSISEANYDSVASSLKIISLSLPFLLTSSVWLSLLEGRSQFLELNVLRSSTGFLTFLTPTLTIIIEPTLISATYGLLASRVLTAAASYYFSIVKGGIAQFQFDQHTFFRLLRFGSWISVSNIISPILVHIDKFIVSNKVGAEFIAMYSAPADLTTKLSFVPQSISRVVFQRLSSDAKGIKSFTETAQHLSFTINLAITLLVFYFAPDILHLWLGPAYGAEAGTILRIMSIGFFFNSLAQVPFSVIQARGRSDITAKIHILEIAPYLLAVAFAASIGGLAAAASVWSARMAVDFLLMLYFCNKLKTDTTDRELRS